MDHEQGVVGHDDPLRAAGDDAGGAVAGTVDAGGDAVAEALQGVVDGEAVEQLAADTVDGDGDRRGAVVLGLEVADEVGGGDAPVADLAVDLDSDVALLALPRGLDAVPVLVGGALDAGRLVEDARILPLVLHGC
ncbi:hypothetical protein D3C75_903010 [compost metagenome]